jgi:hypothetical protein
MRAGDATRPCFALDRAATSPTSGGAGAPAGGRGPAGSLPGVTWSWRYEDADGRPISTPEAQETFNAKGDAESWLGETWRDLLDSGVTQVVLVEDDRVEYAMPLTPVEG